MIHLLPLTGPAGHTMPMLARFLVYGALGWIVEILWTGMGSILRRDPRLTATTYLWMFPIYGGGGYLLERIYPVIAEQPWAVRGLIWMLAIFSIEYATGWLIREAVGQSPWNYTGAPLAVGELIRGCFPLRHPPFVRCPVTAAADTRETPENRRRPGRERYHHALASGV